MRVRLSSDARSYIVNETRYLRARSRSGAEGFVAIVQRAQRLLADFPASGTAASAIPLTGARRAIIGGYLFDYDLIEGVVWIQNVQSSINTQAIAIEDDRDYEA